MLLRNGGIYPEEWKTALCIYRYSQLADVNAEYEALLLVSVSNAKNELKTFAEKYVGIKSLTYISSQEDMVKRMKNITEKVQGKIVTVDFGGKPDR